MSKLKNPNMRPTEQIPGRCYGLHRCGNGIQQEHPRDKHWSNQLWRVKLTSCRCRRRPGGRQAPPWWRCRCRPAWGTPWQALPSTAPPPGRSGRSPVMTWHDVTRQSVTSDATWQLWTHEPQEQGEAPGARAGQDGVGRDEDPWADDGARHERGRAHWEEDQLYVFNCIWTIIQICVVTPKPSFGSTSATILIIPWYVLLDGYHRITNLLSLPRLFCYYNVVQSTLQYTACVTGSNTLLDMFHLAFRVHQWKTGLIITWNWN